MKECLSPFENSFYKLVDDLLADSKRSPDVHKTMGKMCIILVIPYKTPPQKISHWWLSAYDCTGLLEHSRMRTISFFFLPGLKKDLHSVYNEDVKLICDWQKQMIQRGKGSVRFKTFLSRCVSLMMVNIVRETRFVKKVISQNMKVCLISNFYTDVFLLSK